ncbi:4'-phosphopantetheinyl transferase superfamily protein [Streptomyces parvus]|uniref:4'-phosphopantetheinyl transferase superfamily protein n=1 Tax=Streptomyces parvus TaxID=66428 RepID=UPI0021019E0E|nr:4'-phosphopantetheinyl transferase superfamily protein [Streptomyces parvus]MCQ1581995.1 4'-phosphopantetheinyl transferase superfamily protein [Streptomyces parvus]
MHAFTRASPGVCWDRLLFSAKEAVFKVWFPLARCQLDFTEADIRIDPGSGSFSARLLVQGAALRRRGTRQGVQRPVALPPRCPAHRDRPAADEARMTAACLGTPHGRSGPRSAHPRRFRSPSR